MPIDSLTHALTDHRLIDGVVATTNRQNVGRSADDWVSVDQFWAEQVEALAANLASNEKIGTITSAAFFRRFTPTEYGAILSASEADAEVQALLDQLLAAPNVVLSDPRVSAGLAVLAAKDLLDEGRIPQLLAYTRPDPTEPDASLGE